MHKHFCSTHPLFSLFEQSAGLFSIILLIAGIALPTQLRAQFIDMQAGLIGVGDASIAWSDYDQDGDQDLLVIGLNVSGNASTTYYRNLGGLFSPIDDLPFINVSLGDVAWGDYDNDGDEDLLLTGQKNDGVATTQLYRNNGNGTFTDLNAGITALKAGMADWGDYDNDGDLDFFISGVGTDNITITKIYRNTGNWTGPGAAIFDDIGANIRGLRRGDGIWIDADADGDLDLHITGRDTQNSRWSIIYENVNGVFVDSGRNTPVVDLSGVDWADYENDGFPELLIAGTSNSELVGGVYENPFQTSNVIIADQKIEGLEFADVQWADYDHDGALEFAIMGRNSANVTHTRIYEYEGGETFADINAGIIGLYKGQLKWADFDADGDLDLAVAGYNANDIPFTRIYRNVQGTDNDPPSPPFSMYMYKIGQFTNFVWGDAVDDQTYAQDLTFNLRVGTTPGGSEILAPTTSGNSGRGHVRTIENLAPGTYYWSVQTVDEFLAPSEFAFEQVFEIGNDEFVAGSMDLPFKSLRVNPADLDNDGDLDFTLAGSNIGDPWTQIKVYKNQGGSFVEQAVTLPVVRKGIVMTEDYDNDNDLDLVIQGDQTEAFDQQGLISGIYDNDQGGFTHSGITPGNSSLCDDIYPNRILADVDNNGFIDIIKPFNGNSTYPEISVRLNQGGVFESDYTLWGQNVNDGTLVAGDFNSDGKVDLFTTGLDNSQCQGPVAELLTNKGTQFEEEITGITKVWGGVPAWGDYDSDGDMDLITTGDRFGGDDPGFTASFSGVFKNNGSSFTTQSELLANTFDSAASWGDYDMDGDLDLLLTHTHASPLYENRNGTFVNIAGAFDEFVDLHAAFGDFDGDDDLDVIVTGWDNGENRTRIYYNTRGAKNDEPSTPTGLSASVSGSDVTFSWNPSTDEETASPALTYGLRIGTAPGKSDVMSAKARVDGAPLAPVYGNVFHNKSWTINGLADGTYFWSVHAIDAGYMGSSFATEQSFTVGAPPPTGFVDAGIDIPDLDEAAVAWADYDNDNDLDLLISGTRDSGPFTKLYRNSSNTFVDAGLNFSQLDFVSVDWGDYDNDGLQDILMAGKDETGAHRTLLFRNMGTGSFEQQSTTTLPGLIAGSVDWGDYDNDGDLDLLLTGRLSNLDNFAGVFRNDIGEASGFDPGVIPFTEIDAGLPGIRRGQSAWVDYDVDGDLDIILTGQVSDAVTHNTFIYKNNNGTFSPINDGLPDTKFGSVDWGDYDDDGDPDLLITGKVATGWILHVYKNNISSFSLVDAKPGVEFANARWGDYDNDGDLDYIVTGRKADNTRVTDIYRNDNGQFNNINAGLTGVSKAAVAWADYDKDGDLDVLVTGQINDSERVGRLYRNTASTSNTAPTTPGGLSFQTGVDFLKLNWGQGTDAQTQQGGLSYNLRVGITPGGSEIVSTGTSLRDAQYLAGTGNVGQNLSWIIKPLPPGTYYWSVQSVDHGFRGSAYSSEQSFTILDPILPVELVEFSAVSDGAEVIIQWKTASETNNAGFELQIGTSPSVGAIHESPQRESPQHGVPQHDSQWHTHTFIPGAGTTPTAQSYTHRIANLQAGKHRVRLKQIDFDGTFAYSEEIIVEAGAPEAVALMSNAPNPFNPSTLIQYDLNQASNVKLTVYDVRGREVAVLVDQDQAAGRYEVRFDGGHLASGTYFYRLETPSNALTKQMILLK